MRSAECGMRNTLPFVLCPLPFLSGQHSGGMRNAECGMRNTLPFVLCPLPFLSGQHGSGEDEVLEGNCNRRGVRLHALPRLDLYHQRGALEEPDVAFLYRLLFHDLTRNLQQAEPHSSLLRLGNHQVVKARLPLPTKNMQLGLVQPPTLL